MPFFAVFLHDFRELVVVKENLSRVIDVLRLKVSDVILVPEGMLFLSISPVLQGRV